MHLKKLIFLLLVCVLPLSAQQRGGDNEEGTVDTGDGRHTASELGKQWAVFIAIDKYEKWGEDLDFPVKDAQDIKNILLEYYYVNEVKELYNSNATLRNIRLLFMELQDKTGPDDSVFVFHAGHGVNDDRSRSPAWICYDGVRNVADQDGWFYHSQIRSMLDSLEAKHVFLISDSCYSGNLLVKGRGDPPAIADIPRAYLEKSRQVMSSGADETVEDVSEFASRLKYFLKTTETPYVTPAFLWAQIEAAQTTRRLFTQPILSIMPDSQYELGGSFLFFRKNPGQNVAILPPIEPVIGGSTTSGSEPPLPPQPPPPGTYEYFTGPWIAYVDNNNSTDTYEINLSANGRCTVKMINDTTQQETTGNWSFSDSTFRLNALFRNPAIASQQNIQWVSRVGYSGNNSFNILGRASANGSQLRIMFFRNN